MNNIPELTDDEAMVLRFQQARYDGPHFRALEKRGLSNWHDATITDLGIRALAAYDAKQRAKIRVEAMREIKAEVEALASAFRKLGDPFPEALVASRTILKGIDEKIAKEQSQ